MKGILKLAVFGIAISAFISCQKDEPQKTQFWPEWFETSTPINKDFVDVLFFAGTNVGKEFDKDGNEIPNITLTEDQKAKIANECRNAWTLLCPDSVNFYAPYYHQGTMSAITNINLSLIALSVAGEDALKIFRYYMDNINGGRPFILAGYSQGAIMVKDILSSLTDEEYSYMKAAYMMGLGLNDEALNDPHIKPATGEFDKGVTISYNSAAGKEDIWEIILANTHYCINPVNWKTDDTPATFKYDGMELTNHIDPDTHVLFVDGFDFETHPVAFPGFPAGWTEHNLHLYEVKMYAPFLRKNIKDRAYRSVH